jgi:hypothetical protein
MSNLTSNDRGLCAEADSEAWYPVSTGALEPENAEVTMTALKICMKCPIREACLLYAFESDHSIDYGIYGGTFPHERKRALRYQIIKGDEHEQKLRKLAISQGIETAIIPKTVRRPPLLNHRSARKLLD